MTLRKSWPCCWCCGLRRALGKGEKWDRIWDVTFDGEGLGRVVLGAILGERLGRG